MSGHSKWSTIKRKKSAEDAKRGKIFTRIAKEVTLAAREGGGDESMNPKLALAVSKAKAANMPKDNIERAIKKGTGELEGGQLESFTYEGYGIDGVAFIVEVLTDNKNRALAEVKNAFNKNGGSLASNGAVSWQFEQKGYITITREGVDFDELFLVAAEAGAEDVVDEGDAILVFTPREAYGAVESTLRENGYKVEDGELRWFAQNETVLPVSKAMQNMRLLERLEDLDDVQSVSSNLEITEELALAYDE
ncbi:YebC/PmpR family DNA-binding transcriptional regulator [Phototrophicus methaneseepsis]|uniref:Probable transcriptional regulatory protein G4Y79_15550 n=1 Tax=Phototrophicus methaneseepsis TaxID=2710758 RepID=A0A7S8ID23_9CHLR|nr:YebC/PmpR family DNA-binding transcriptional regulator [Phototrophicus methaneseepsis]QPC81117.1 YebC/PmpR family DNA-binding transcriptional regulator [Phototrophicus methaneseepsis]